MQEKTWKMLLLKLKIRFLASGRLKKRFTKNVKHSNVDTVDNSSSKNVLMNVEKSVALIPADKFTKKETLFVEPKTMCCDNITKVLMGGGLNIFKGTGCINKYV